MTFIHLTTPTLLFGGAKRDPERRSNLPKDTQPVYSIAGDGIEAFLLLAQYIFLLYHESDKENSTCNCRYYMLI